MGKRSSFGCCIISLGLHRDTFSLRHPNQAGLEFDLDSFSAFLHSRRLGGVIRLFSPLIHSLIEFILFPSLQEELEQSGKVSDADKEAGAVPRG